MSAQLLLLRFAIESYFIAQAFFAEIVGVPLAGLFISVIRQPRLPL
jgi:hypothetical protein